MNKMISSALAAAVTLAVFVPPVVFAQEKQEDPYTQQQFMLDLTIRLGIIPSFGGNVPTPKDCEVELLRFGVQPVGGWQYTEPVTPFLLTQVLVQVFVAQGAKGAALPPKESENDPQAWLDALKKVLEDLRVVETVEGTLRAMKPDLGVQIIAGWYAMSADQLIARIIGSSQVVTQGLARAQVAAVIGGARVVRRDDATPDTP
jgi:hypothetical protein